MASLQSLMRVLAAATRSSISAMLLASVRSTPAVSLDATRSSGVRRSSSLLCCVVLFKTSTPLFTGALVVGVCSELVSSRDLTHAGADPSQPALALSVPATPMAGAGTWQTVRWCVRVSACNGRCVCVCVCVCVCATCLNTTSRPSCKLEHAVGLPWVSCLRTHAEGGYSRSYEIRCVEFIPCRVARAEGLVLSAQRIICITHTRTHPPPYHSFAKFPHSSP